MRTSENVTSKDVWSVSRRSDGRVHVRVVIGGEGYVWDAPEDVAREFFARGNAIMRQERVWHWLLRLARQQVRRS